MRTRARETQLRSLPDHSPVTPLASARINRDLIAVELLEPHGRPAVVRIVWPAHASIVDTSVFPDTAATVAQLFARAHIVLAGLKASGEFSDFSRTSQTTKPKQRQQQGPWG